MEDSKKNNVIAKDFKDGDVVTFLRDMARIAKRDNIQSALVMTVSEDGHVSWESWTTSPHDAALMTLAMEDAREEMKSVVFGAEVE